ncbi:MAG: sel1 repeat family protein [Sneathiella sp.]|nr:sel1 repeat family protein [Sneathiella sp.]
MNKPAEPKAPVVVAAKPVKVPSVAKSRPITGSSALTLPEKLELAELAFTLEEYQQALIVWAPLAQKGNAEAQYNLGNMFLGGHALPIDRVRAYSWWEKARNSGSTKAEDSLAKLEKSLTFLEKRQLQRAK